ncbi:hypothetical protein ACFVU3_08850 [Streptomyces sp. NPDC058052]|uniref:hypothetical protein n=1 Tax=Streptomyces sp. NPDC058052 TaxID=3346316 RepID=UPI0036E75633
MSRRPFRATASLTVLPLLLAGCAGAGGTPPTAGGATARDGARTPPPAAAVPVIDSANDKPLPLDPYLVNPGQQATIDKAYATALSRCMARFGFDYRPPVEAPAPRDSDAPVTRTDGRYGSQSAELMARWGYHPEGSAVAEIAPAHSP